MTTASRPSSVFFWYTATSALVLVAGMPVFALFVSWVEPPDLPDHPLSAALFVLQTALSTAAAAWWLVRWRDGLRDRPLPRRAHVAAAAPAVVAPVMLLARAISPAAPDEQDPMVMINLITVLSGLVTVHMVLRWWTAILSAAALTGIAVLAGLPLPVAAPIGSFMLAIVIGLRSSLWLLELVDGIDRARQMEGLLALAEERLRFSRDLHDVMGRDLSSIAVTAELVTQLAERGDPRAAEHARSISAMARSSLADVRALVRGYRDVDLASELQGTLSLLRSAGIRTHLRGEVQDVPAEHAEAATWVLREAGTNLLRHADATAVTIELGAGGLTVTNDGALAVAADGGQPVTEGAQPVTESPRPVTENARPVTEGTGLRGLRERIGPARALSARREGESFTLALHFAPGTGTASTPGPIDPGETAPTPSDGGPR
ncbi:histidine kinase [Brachybacterium sp. Marseille-Q2903]|uniref:Histidine kinase n=1 Tax=Brachybacterium epidermidis TaxID=2781983 RepID=A0ABR9W0H4_9MICO|nr:histidine kinase [Brachybacterium epidermidis]MBE9403931.1 histidine kinase [Brachybacterium epidermidis]